MIFERFARHVGRERIVRIGEVGQRERHQLAPHRRVLALTFGPDFILWRRSGESWPRVWPGRRLFFLRNAPAAAAVWPISYGVASARDCGSLASSRKVQHSEGSFIRLDRAQRTRTSSAFSSLGSAPRGRAAKTLGHAPSQRRQAPRQAAA